MELSFKKELLTFVKAHDDGSEETKRLAEKLERECGYAECDSHSVCPDDINNAFKEIELESIKKHFGKKKNEDLTLEDCQVIADWLSDYISEEYGENLRYAVMENVELIIR